MPEPLIGCLLTVAVPSIGLTLSSSFLHAVATARAETVDDRHARYTGRLSISFFFTYGQALLSGLDQRIVPSLFRARPYLAAETTYGRYSLATLQPFGMLGAAEVFVRLPQGHAAPVKSTSARQ